MGEVVHENQTALHNESEKYNGALRDTVSMRNHINAMQQQIRTQRDELSLAKRQNDGYKKKLEEAIEMFRKVQEQLKEREKVIQIKDETLSKLRSNQKHLESFRYVLFHKVQTLEKERDPLEAQVGELRESVQG